MALRPGVPLGAYEIVALIGAGGMGEVYRARDSRLKREVAIKVLPDAFANDPERLARFQREAELLATLNHPNIAQIYGLEDRALVLEFVDGPTLADRIAEGPLPLDEALPIARQITEALEAAHERGIIHRDLKPANIKVRPDGTVKVLDFGLAKALEPAAPVPNVSQSPTITSPALATHVGIILGTAAYMSPEQARGKPVDERSDIWAFGCVLYEMLAGERAFQGEDVAEVLANIINREANSLRLPQETPPALKRLLRRTLEKDRRRRLSSIDDARLEIDDAISPPPESQGARSVTKLSLRLPWVAAAIAVAGASAMAVVSFGGWNRLEAPPVPARRFALAERFMAAGAAQGKHFAVSPDGRLLAYIGQDRTLNLRSFDSLESSHFPQLGTMSTPFFSPDSQWIGFFSAGSNELKKIAVAGGPPMTLSQTPGTPRGATWTSDGTIVFGVSGSSSGLWTVSSNGGKPVETIKPEPGSAESLGMPHAIPGTQLVLYTAIGISGPIGTRVEIVDLLSLSRKPLIDGGGEAHYTPRGHLLYSMRGSLFGVPFDLRRLELAGDPTLVLAQVQTGPYGLVYASVSDEGTLVYLSGDGLLRTQRNLVWVDRSGKEELLPFEPKPYGVPRLSPDGLRIAVDVLDPQTPNLFVYDLNRQSTLRLTFGSTIDVRPAWTPDGKWIFYRGDTSGLGIYRKPSDGAGSIELVRKVFGDGAPSSFTPDGKTLIFNTFDSRTGRDTWSLDLEDRSERPLAAELGSQGNAVLSPNGKWLAYSDENEGLIFVTPFPDVRGGRWQVSPNGSKWPVWSRDGKELFFISGQPRAMWGVRVLESTERSFQSGPPKQLFVTSYYNTSGLSGPRGYDVAADGRFIFVKEPDRSSEKSSLVVVENWFSELDKSLGTRAPELTR